MSQAQITATAVLCRLLERDDLEINGQALYGDQPDAAAHLQHERLLMLGQPLEWVNCHECRLAHARVMRALPVDRIELFCPECEIIDAPRKVRETWKVSLPRVLAGLLAGLRLTAHGMKPIEPDLVWRLGTTEPERGRALTWYFARLLTQVPVAARLREQIALERTSSSCVVLTSSQLPLPVASPMLGFDVRTLPSVARIGQNRFEFFLDRQALPGPQVLAEARPQATGVTTLQYLRAHCKVFIAGVEHTLEPSQQSILLALIDSTDHEMGKDALKSACGSQAQRFSPRKEFQRSPLVYKTFIRYLRDDGRYALVIPEGDRVWLM